MKEHLTLTNKQIHVENIGMCQIKNWQPQDAKEIFNKLEIYNWAPWLKAEPNSLAGRAKTFPEGHLLISSPAGEIIATLSTNRINWDGKIESLPTWDQVAGDPTTFKKTYQKEGNTLVLMSMNVHPQYKKLGLATELIKEVKELSQKLKITHLIGSFRPSEFGKYKQEHEEIDFAQYRQMIRPEDNLPIDAWLRSLIRNGMQPLTVDKNAMTVTIPYEEFLSLLKNYNPNQWKEVKLNVWECGEVGHWVIDPELQIATYTESNLWGKI